MKENRDKSGKARDSNEPPDTFENSQVHRCETIDEGTDAFMQWMNSADKKSLSSANPIVLIKFKSLTEVREIIINDTKIILIIFGS